MINTFMIDQLEKMLWLLGLSQELTGSRQKSYQYFLKLTSSKELSYNFNGSKEPVETPLMIALLHGVLILEFLFALDAFSGRKNKS